MYGRRPVARQATQERSACAMAAVVVEPMQGTAADVGFRPRLPARRGIQGTRRTSTAAPAADRG